MNVSRETCPVFHVKHSLPPTDDPVGGSECSMNNEGQATLSSVASPSPAA